MARYINFGFGEGGGGGGSIVARQERVAFAASGNVTASGVQTLARQTGTLADYSVVYPTGETTFDLLDPSVDDDANTYLRVKKKGIYYFSIYGQLNVPGTTPRTTVRFLVRGTVDGTSNVTTGETKVIYIPANGQNQIFEASGTFWAPEDNWIFQIDARNSYFTGSNATYSLNAGNTLDVVPISGISEGGGQSLTDGQIGAKAFANPPISPTASERTAFKTALNYGISDILSTADYLNWVSLNSLPSPSVDTQYNLEVESSGGINWVADTGASLPATVTGSEIADGTETALRSYSPEDILAFITTHAPERWRGNWAANTDYYAGDYLQFSGLIRIARIDTNRAAYNDNDWYTVPPNRNASETQTGQIELANSTEVAAGASAGHAVSPLRLRENVGPVVTDAEITAGTGTNVRRYTPEDITSFVTTHGSGALTSAQQTALTRAGLLPDTSSATANQVMKWDFIDSAWTLGSDNVLTYTQVGNAWNGWSTTDFTLQATGITIPAAGGRGEIVFSQNKKTGSGSTYSPGRVPVNFDILLAAEVLTDTSTETNLPNGAFILATGQGTQVAIYGRDAANQLMVASSEPSELTLNNLTLYSENVTSAEGAGQGGQSGVSTVSNNLLQISVWRTATSTPSAPGPVSVDSNNNVTPWPLTGWSSTMPTSVLNTESVFGARTTLYRNSEGTWTGGTFSVFDEGDIRVQFYGRNSLTAVPSWSYTRWTYNIRGRFWTGADSGWEQFPIGEEPLIAQMTVPASGATDSVATVGLNLEDFQRLEFMVEHNNGTTQRIESWAWIDAEDVTEVETGEATTRVIGSMFICWARRGDAWVTRTVDGMGGAGLSPSTESGIWCNFVGDARTTISSISLFNHSGYQADTSGLTSASLRIKGIV